MLSSQNPLVCIATLTVDISSSDQGEKVLEVAVGKERWIYSLCPQASAIKIDLQSVPFLMVNMYFNIPDPLLTNSIRLIIFSS